MKKILLFVLTNLWLFLPGLAQEKIVTGKVTDRDEGDPLPGVNVIVKGTTIGTFTDAEGGFSINVPGSSSILVFSFVGLKTIEVEAGSNTIIDVRMETDATQLSEVIVTGYSTQNARSVAGSVASVKAETIERVPLASFDQALQGQVPGVLIQAQSGQPGAAASVLIRGKGSLLGTNAPLFILDGVEITASDFSTLNQADFASISVLKDASATSIYGSRGANGVIVISSKKGAKGKIRINYDVQYGTSRAPENKLDLMNSAEKLSYELANGNPYDWTDEDVARLSQINTDWADVFFQEGKTQSHTLNFSGGSDKTSFFISGSLFDQTGTVINTGLKRYTGRMNVESGLGDFSFGINSTFGYSDFTNTTENNTGIATPLNAIRWTNPYETPYDENGEYTEIVSGQPNALQELLENSNLRQQLKAIGNVYAAYNIPFVKGLSIKTSWGGDFTSNERSIYVDGTTATGAGTPSQKGSLNRQYGKRFRYTGTTSITFDKELTPDHHLNVSLYNEIVKSNSNSFFFTGFGLGGPFENEAGITPGNNSNGFIPAVGGNDSDGFNAESILFRGGPSALLSYFASINYGFKDKYFLSVGVRRDGSSRFGANNRYANFGSIGASWIVSDESFMAGLKDNIFNELKFKVSYGTAGNQAGLGAFQATELYGRGVYNGVSGLIQNQLANPDLRWEKKTTFNTGIEMATLQGRLNATVEYYHAITSDLFLGKPLSLTTGYSTLTSNVGELQNSGVEISLNSDIIKTDDFRWNVNVNLTYNKNKINKLLEGQDEIINGLILTRPGESINTLYVVRYTGVNPQNGAAQYLTKHGEVTEVYDPADRVVVGTYEAPYFGGFGTTLSYKGIELSGLFSYVLGNKIYNNDRNNVENPDYFYDNLSVDLLREWRNPGDITDIPSPGNQYRASTTRFVEDGDFLRLRNIILSYTLPSQLISKAKLSSVRVYVQGQNLLTFTDFKGFDPEISTGNLSGAQYPALRTVTAGLTIGF
jgi:TonB-dependent starch-binding outer membrane protein SusC